MNFDGEVEDINTLAHELGHGIHAYLSRKNPLLEFGPSTAVAELASTFAENLVFEKIFNEVKDKKVKINLLANKIQGTFATIFRQSVFYLFESEIHQSRREKGELSLEDIGNSFQRHLQLMFGKGLKLTDQHKFWWMPIMHFFHYNFYVFTYALGDMLTTALYGKYKESGEKFVQKYLEALSVGGSKDPYEITKIMGVDISEEDFWEKGMKLIDLEVEEFGKLVG